MIRRLAHDTGSLSPKINHYSIPRIFRMSQIKVKSFRSAFFHAHPRATARQVKKAWREANRRPTPGVEAKDVVFRGGVRMPFKDARVAMREAKVTSATRAAKLLRCGHRTASRVVA